MAAASIQTGYNPRERVKLVIGHKETDRVPKGEICLEDPVVAQSLQVNRVGFEERLEFATRLGLDIICLHPKHPVLQGGLPDSGAVVWPELKDWVYRSQLFTFAVLDGALGWGTRVFGCSEFLVLPKRSPLVFAEFIRKVESLNLALARDLIEAGVDGLIIADDMAYERGLLFGPEITRGNLLPSLASQVEKIAPAGKPVFLHSDGNLNGIMAEIVSAGFNGLHCIDKNAGMDPLQLQQLYGANLCLWGSLGVTDLEEAHEPDRLASLADEINLLNRNKGFILGTSSGLFPGINLSGLTRIYARIRGRF